MNVQKTGKRAKLLICLMATAFVLAFVPMSASADDTWDSVTVDGLTVSVSSGTEALEIVQNSAYDFDIDSTDDDYPFSFSLLLTANGYSGTPAVSNGGTWTKYSTSGGIDYCLVTPPEGTTSTLTIITAANGYTLTFHLDMPTGGTAGGSGTGILAYLPAPGQFDNEGITTGGWGDIYQSGSSSLKTLVNAYSPTGVSLGAFGGSIVFDFGESGIANDPENPYGVDFIVYGNAFTNWSEPGCIQVSQDGSTWYDIAGSRHYLSGTDWNCEIVYADPTPSDNTGGTSTRANVPYADADNVTVNGSTQTWSSYSTMTTNAYHNHSWFPLARNYFDTTERNATGYSSAGGASGPMANVSVLPFATLKEAQTVRDGSNNNIVSNATTTISFKGVNLNQTSNNTSLFTFGYADVHANGTVDSVAHNPYAVTASTTGGDPIDISWAVNSQGEPVYLESVRFVRVYTGVMNVSGAFGETSTEVCGIYTATGTGSGNASEPSITIDGNTIEDIVSGSGGVVTSSSTEVSRNQKIITVSGLYEYGYDTFTLAASGGTYIYINDSNTSSAQIALSEGVTTYVRVISQSGTAEPFVLLLKLS